MNVRSVVRLRFLQHVLTFALIVMLAPSHVAHAESAQDIPGVPLEGGTVSSEVGASIIDRVYAVALPQGAVVTATVIGEPGAELGLYIFSEAATSIGSSDPISHSSRPGSRQATSAPVVTGGTVYINVNGRNTERPYRFTLKVLVRVDTTPPFVTSINTPERSTSGHLCLKVNAIDSQSGVRDIGIRSTPSEGDDAFEWQPFIAGVAQCFVVSAAEGSHSFQVTARNRLMIKSSPREFEVTIDDSPPQVVATSPESEGAIFSALPKISWKFSERIYPLNTLAELVFATNQDGEVLSGVVSLSSNRKLLTWRAGSRVAQGSTLLVGLGAFKDAAGNQQPFSSTVVLTRFVRTSLSGTVLAVTSSYAKLMIVGSASLIGQTVQVQVKTDIGWADYQDVRVSAGSMKISIAGDTIRKVRLHWAGDDRLYESTSAVIAIR